MTSLQNCPCNSNKTYDDCCGLYHKTPGSAPTAETLMRSRYTAFQQKNFDYIARTQKLADNPKQTAAEIKKANDATQWTKLEILETQDGREQDKTGMVAFSAHFKEGRHVGKLSERSLFKRLKEEWVYISGEHEVKNNQPLVKSADMNMGRNDPCSCGSGKKFKKCCA